MENASRLAEDPMERTITIVCKVRSYKGFGDCRVCSFKSWEMVLLYYEKS